MLSQKSTMKDKLENMRLKERINYGYRKVIIMILISGLFSIVVIGVLFANMLHYIDDVNAADQAVKICRINVNASARNIREMAFPSSSTLPLIAFADCEFFSTCSETPATVAVSSSTTAA